MSGSDTGWEPSRVQSPLPATLRGRDWLAAGGCLLAVVVGIAVAYLPLPLAGALVAGAIVMIASLIRPQFGVLLVVVAVPFGAVRQIAVGSVGVGLTEVMVVLVLACWFARRVAYSPERLLLPPLTYPLAALMAAILLSTLGATSLEHSLVEIIKWAEILAFYVLVYNEFDEQWARALMVTMLVTGAVAALQGVYQFLFQVGPEGFILFGRFMRSHGTFGQPNPYAGYLGLVMPLGLAMLADGLARGSKRLAWGWALLGGAAAVLMLCAILMSWSRGAWLGAAAGSVAVALGALYRGGRARAWFVAAIALLVGGLLAMGLVPVPSLIGQRISDFVPYLSLTDVRGVEITDANFAVLERVAHWQAAWGMWTRHPWLGVGIGNYEVAYAQFRQPLWTEALGHAHNYYLNMAAETGIVGLLAFAVLLCWAILSVWRTIRRSAGWQLGASLGALGMLVHLGVHSVFDNLFVHGIYLQVALALGLVAGVEWRSNRIES